MNKFQSLMSEFFTKQTLMIIVLGFLSGLPLSLSASLMQTWLTEIGISLKTIGFFSNVGLMYSLKFLWAPLIDSFNLPILTNKLGRRKSWLLLTQILLSISIVILGATDPLEHPFYTALFACVMSFLAATQDIIIDAYRIEILAKEQEKQGIGLTMFIYSYRLALLATSAGGLILSQYFSWFAVYASVALIIFFAAILIAIFAKEPISVKIDYAYNSIKEMFAKVIFSPLKDFSTKKNWLMILMFTISFKLGDAMLGVMTQPFLLNIGFDKITIVKISKLFGFWATMFGTLCGGVLVYRLGMLRSLWIGGVLQMITNGLFALQAHVGYSVKLLAVTIGAESFTSGLGSAVFIAYLSSICSLNFTATQYAMLSSLAGFARTTIASPSGVLVEHFGWFWFAIITMFAALPGLFFLLLLNKSFTVKDK